MPVQNDNDDLSESCAIEQLADGLERQEMFMVSILNRHDRTINVLKRERKKRLEMETELKMMQDQLKKEKSEKAQLLNRVRLLKAGEACASVYDSSKYRSVKVQTDDCFSDIDSEVAKQYIDNLFEKEKFYQQEFDIEDADNLPISVADLFGTEVYRSQRSIQNPHMRS